MFDEYFNPLSIVCIVPAAGAPRAIDLADSLVSTSIDQDAPSISFEESPKTPTFRDDPLHESLHEDSTSQGSSSNMRQTHTPFEHLENKDAKKSNEMYYPRFTKVIVNFFMTKDQSIPRRNKDTQRYSAILPKELTNEDIRNFESYKEYYVIASGAEPPKTKASIKKKQVRSDTTMPPPTAKGKRIKTSAKALEPAKKIEEDDDDEVNMSEHDDDDDEQTNSDNDDDDFVHPKFSTHDDEDKEEESFDPRVQTPSHVETTDDEDNDEDSQGVNVKGNELDEEKANEEDEGYELHRDVNINLEDLKEPIHQEFIIGFIEDQLVKETSHHPDWFQKSEKAPTPDRDWNKTFPAQHGPVQPWISNIARKDNSRDSFNKLMDTPLGFSAFMMNRLKETTDQLDWNNPEGQQYPHDLLKPLPLIPKSQGCRVIPFDHFINNDLEYLSGGVSSRKYTTSVTKTKAADYGNIKWIEDLVLDRIESARDVYSKRRIIVVTELQIVEWHNYKHLDWITVRRDDDKLYKFKEGDFNRLHIQDIEDMLLLLVQGKLTNLNVAERLAFNVSLPVQPWISNIAQKDNSRDSCNKLMDTPLGFSAFMMNRLKEITDQLDWNNPEGQQYPHDLLKPLPLIPKSQGFRVIPFDHFINNDLEYLSGGVSSRKYTTSVTKTKAADYGNIKWIEDLVPDRMWSQVPVSYDKHALWGISH
uniref:Uncharacterized protein n=1 Tax=Tanacetum cinerariifolium TaxID=118510 RepID=A0A6L2MTQ6_TANCI|nr:hypothetical protein [Tanacetum cinerariifolium]